MLLKFLNKDSDFVFTGKVKFCDQCTGIIFSGGNLKKLRQWFNEKGLATTSLKVGVSLQYKTLFDLQLRLQIEGSYLQIMLKGAKKCAMYLSSEGGEIRIQTFQGWKKSADIFLFDLFTPTGLRIEEFFMEDFIDEQKGFKTTFMEGYFEKLEWIGFEG